MVAPEMRDLRFGIVTLGLLWVGLGCRTKPPAPETPPVDTVTAPAPAPVAHQATAPPSPSTPGGTRGPGPEACADCHPDEADGFAATGMGRSLYRPADRPPIEDFDPKKATVEHPISKIRYRAYVDPEGRWWQEETFAGTDHRQRVQAQYVIGSGNHTRSYLGVLEGNLVQLPLTWYSARAIWDLSPGYERADHFRFTRPVKPMCIFCHNDLTPARDATMAGYEGDLRLGISCARCHGDGTAHVAAREAGQGPAAGAADPTIFNPQRASKSHQLQVCQQCHLTGKARVLLPGGRWDTYDPRQPLRDYMSIYTHAQDGGAEFGIASHGHRLSLSRCAQASGDQLTCTRCHDPHQRDTTKSHRTACLECHQQKDCGDAHEIGPEANCAGCHMHRGDTSDIPHVTFTDHYIRKKPTAADTPARPKTLELVDALGPPRGPADAADAAVRLGMAHARTWRFASKPAHLPVAISTLIKALKLEPRRPKAWMELGVAFAGRGDNVGARMAFAQLASLTPDGVLFRIDYAEALEALGELDEAAAQLRKAIELRPDYRVAWGNLANILQRQRRFEDAEAAYIKADALAPHLALTAHNRGYNAMSRGDDAAAERWFREGLRRDGVDPAGHFNLGTLSLKKKDLKAARAHFDVVLMRKPKHASARWLRGRLHLQAGRYVEAREDLETMVNVDPRNPHGYLELARLELALENFGGARQALLRGRGALPRHPVIDDAMGRLIRGEAP